MDILLLSTVDLSDSATLGIKKKLIGQMAGFEALGYKVALVARYGTEMVKFSLDGTNIKTIISRRGYSKGEKIIALMSLCREHKNIYFRYAVGGIVTALVLFLFKLAGKRIFTEFPTFPYKGEFTPSIHGWLSKQLDRLTFGCVKSVSVFFINCSGQQIIANKHTLFLQNGVYLSTQPCKKETSADPCRFVFVGNLSSWQGVDRIIGSFVELVKEEPSSRYYLTVIGNGPEFSNLRALVEELGLPGRIRLTGALAGEELTKILSLQDLAFSSSAIDRKSLNRLSAIKTCEYSANGLPFILNYEDINFPETEDLPFVIRMPYHTVDIRSSIQQYKRIVKEYPNLHTDARCYAEAHLSWEAKMRPIAEGIMKSARPDSLL